MFILNVELSHLSEDVLYYILLGGVEPTLLEKKNKKEFICLCAKLVCAAKKNLFAFVQNWYVQPPGTIIEPWRKI
jgi:hypothetical protein